MTPTHSGLTRENIKSVSGNYHILPHIHRLQGTQLHGTVPHGTKKVEDPKFCSATISDFASTVSHLQRVYTFRLTDAWYCT
jgi:hypothetical protein